MHRPIRSVRQFMFRQSGATRAGAARGNLLRTCFSYSCTQSKAQVGNYPVMNVYANFYVRAIRLKFFAQYQHFNASFMGKQYFGMPDYPLAPDMFRAGLAWHFYK